MEGMYHSTSIHCRWSMNAHIGSAHMYIAVPKSRSDGHLPWCTSITHQSHQLKSTIQSREVESVHQNATHMGFLLWCIAGLNSSMGGLKALALEKQARRLGIPYLRYDYQGHGQSSGTFIDKTLGDW